MTVRNNMKYLNVLLCVTLILNSENVYFKRSDLFSALYEIILVFVCVAYVCVSRLYKKLTRYDVRNLIILSTSYMLIIITIYVLNIDSSSINNTLQKLVILGVLLPLLIVIFRTTGYFDVLKSIIRTYVNISAFISCLGLFLWILFNLGIHLPSINVPYQWGGPRIGSGVLGLTFDVQYSDIQFAQGWSRYTLFYVEGGIAAAYFGLSGILESTCNRNPRLPIVIMFAACTFCTLSGFGMILSPIVLCVGILCNNKIKQVSKNNIIIYFVSKLLIIAIILSMPYIIFSLFSQKTNEGSIAAHTNDFTFGFGVFLERPLFGYGIGNYAPLHNTIDGLSGTSSSLMLGLIQGGIVYVAAILIPFCYASILSLANQQYRTATLYITLLFLYINGMSDNSPTYICMMALSYSYIYHITSVKRQSHINYTINKYNINLYQQLS